MRRVRLPHWMRSRIRSERGQSMTEYLLTISVIVTFVVASSYFGFIPTMSQGVKAWGTQYETYYAKPGGPGN